MNKLILLLMFSMFICGNLYTQVFAQTVDNTPGYRLNQNTPNPFEENTIIKFTLKEDCYVKITAVSLQSNKSILLVDGEMVKGEHGIVFKCPDERNSGSREPLEYKCKMEIYSLSPGVLVYESEIRMLQK